MKDYFGYTGKVCVVTGASSGMGKATAELLVEMGAKVYALSRREPGVEGIAFWTSTDLSSKESIDAAFAQLPEKIDCYFGMAGISGITATLVKTFTVDFLANKYITETYLENRIVDGGAILYVTSSSAIRWTEQKMREEYEPVLHTKTWDEGIAAFEELSKTIPDFMAYIPAKRAMNFYAASISSHFAERDIRVNCVLPSSTRTGMMDEFVAINGSDEIYKTYIGNGKEFAQPSTMAKACVYLNSDFAEYITGYELVVDAGLEGATRCGQVYDVNGLSVKETLAMMASQQ